MELIISTAFILLIFIILVLYAHQKITESNEFREILDAKRICQSFASNINTISKQGPNYYRYFSIPLKVYGGREYNLSNYKNIIEISWESKYSPFSTSILTENVTIICLDKGMDKKNKILNDDGNILITCYRPDLKPIAETFQPLTARPGENVTISIDIMNFGAKDSGAFDVKFNTTTVRVPGLSYDNTITVSADITVPDMAMNYTIQIYVDSNNEINESIEDDNWYNGTIMVG